MRPIDYSCCIEEKIPYAAPGRRNLNHAAPPAKGPLNAIQSCCYDNAPHYSDDEEETSILQGILSINIC